MRIRCVSSMREVTPAAFGKCVSTRAPALRPTTTGVPHVSRFSRHGYNESQHNVLTIFLLSRLEPKYRCRRAGLPS
jgi:hypothetical protein